MFCGLSAIRADGECMIYTIEAVNDCDVIYRFYCVIWCSQKPIPK